MFMTTIIYILECICVQENLFGHLQNIIKEWNYQHESANNHLKNNICQRFMSHWWHSLRYPCKTKSCRIQNFHFFQYLQWLNIGLYKNSLKTTTRSWPWRSRLPMEHYGELGRAEKRCHLTAAKRWNAGGRGLIKQ